MDNKKYRTIFADMEMHKDMMGKDICSTLSNMFSANTYRRTNTRYPADSYGIVAVAYLACIINEYSISDSRQLIDWVIEKHGTGMYEFLKKCIHDYWAVPFIFAEKYSLSELMVTYLASYGFRRGIHHNAANIALQYAETALDDTEEMYASELYSGISLFMTYFPLFWNTFLKLNINPVEEDGYVGIMKAHLTKISFKNQGASIDIGCGPSTFARDAYEFIYCDYPYTGSDEWECLENKPDINEISKWCDTKYDLINYPDDWNFLIEAVSKLSECGIAAVVMKKFVVECDASLPIRKMLVEKKMIHGIVEFPRAFSTKGESMLLFVSRRRAVHTIIVDVGMLDGATDVCEPSLLSTEDCVKISSMIFDETDQKPESVRVDARMFAEKNYSFAPRSYTEQYYTGSHSCKLRELTSAITFGNTSQKNAEINNATKQTNIRFMSGLELPMVGIWNLNYETAGIRLKENFLQTNRSVSPLPEKCNGNSKTVCTPENQKCILISQGSERSKIVLVDLEQGQSIVPGHDVCMIVPNEDKTDIYSLMAWLKGADAKDSVNRMLSSGNPEYLADADVTIPNNKHDAKNISNACCEWYGKLKALGEEYLRQAEQL